MMELPLGDQVRKALVRFVKTMIKGFVASGSTISIVIQKEITENHFKITLDKFKNQDFKAFVDRHQVNYI